MYPELFHISFLHTYGVLVALAFLSAVWMAAHLARRAGIDAEAVTNLLYRGKHIPGAIYAGPASKEAGLDALKVAVDKLPRDRAIVVYCGCCPWVNCPNVKPAVEFLQRMGFAHVKAMYVESNFAKDWIDKGYPVELGTPKP